VGRTAIHVCTSVGSATDAFGDTDWQQLIDRADANLLDAKTGVENGTQIEQCREGIR
jgi:GGDEF domain-containing protein